MQRGRVYDWKKQVLLVFMQFCGVLCFALVLALIRKYLY